MGDEQDKINQPAGEVQTNQQDTKSSADTTVNKNVTDGVTGEPSEIDKLAEGLGFDTDDEIIKGIKGREEPKEKEPDKIKFDGKEFNTEEDVKKYILDQNKPTEPKEPPRFRQENEIAQDFINLKENTTRTLKNVFDKFIALSNAPKDAEGKADYKGVHDALSHGINTGDYDYFYQYLNPVDVAKFKDEKTQIENDYLQKVKPLESETKSYIENQNINKWDSFIKDNSKDEQELHLLQEFKKIYPNNLVEKEMTSILKVFRDARAIEINKTVLKEQTEQMKQAMMGTNVSDVNKGQQQVKVQPGFTKDMSSTVFEKLLDSGELDKYLV